MNNFLNVSCFQTNSSENPSKNIEMLSKMFEKNKTKPVDLICLPECVAIFTDSKNKLDDYFTNWHQNFFNFISEQAKKKRSFLLVGSIPFKKKNGKFVNRSLLLSDSGKIIDHYDKINLFDVILSKKEKYLESKNYDPGKIIKISKLPWGKLGMSICYDLRFPNLYKKLAKKGADFFSVPAAFTNTTGKVHWHSLLKARAIENGCYIFAPAQCGTHDNGRTTYGHSMIINPWGEVLKEAEEKISIINQKISLDIIYKVRKKIPSTRFFD